MSCGCDNIINPYFVIQVDNSVNQISVVSDDFCSTQIEIDCCDTNTVEVISFGPSGPQGPSSIDTSSFVINSQTSSMSVLNSIYSETASYVTNAQTASYVNLLAGPNIIINRVGSIFQISGSTFSINTSSFILNSQTASMSVLTSSYSLTSSYYNETDPIFNLNSSSYTRNSQTGSFVLNSQTASMSVLSSSYAQTASYVTNAQTASYVLSSSYAQTASIAQSTNTINLLGSVDDGVGPWNLLFTFAPIIGNNRIVRYSNMVTYDGITGILNTTTTQSISSSYALNGGVTDLIVGNGISLNNTIGSIIVSVDPNSIAVVDTINLGSSNYQIEFIRPQELEQSKHTTINIFNYNNF